MERTAGQGSRDSTARIDSHKWTAKTARTGLQCSIARIELFELWNRAFNNAAKGVKSKNSNSFLLC